MSYEIDLGLLGSHTAEKVRYVDPAWDLNTVIEVLLGYGIENDSFESEPIGGFRKVKIKIIVEEVL